MKITNKPDVSLLGSVKHSRDMHTGQHSGVVLLRDLWVMKELLRNTRNDISVIITDKGCVFEMILNSEASLVLRV